jgi:hypothetical protein
METGALEKRNSLLCFKLNRDYRNKLTTNSYLQTTLTLRCLKKIHRNSAWILALARIAGIQGITYDSGQGEISLHMLLRLIRQAMFLMIIL